MNEMCGSTAFRNECHGPLRALFRSGLLRVALLAALIACPAEAGWRYTRGMPDQMGAMWGASPTDLFFTGWADQHILRWRDREWITTRSTADSSLDWLGEYSVWGFSPEDVWVGSSLSGMLRWDGSTWTRYRPSIENLEHGHATSVNSIWGISPDDIWASCGFDRVLHHCHVLQIDGRSFRLRHMEGLVQDE